jgi:hypothetical protein
MSPSLIREEPSISEERRPIPGNYIAFEGNVDGPRDPFFEALEALARPEIVRICSKCEGFVSRDSINFEPI